MTTDFDALTKQQQVVMALLAEGLTNRQIAKRMFLSEGTVKSHVSRVLRKIGAQNRTDAAVRYMREEVRELRQELSQHEVVTALPPLEIDLRRRLRAASGGKG